jgi:hypothetical protein
MVVKKKILNKNNVFLIFVLNLKQKSKKILNKSF